MSNAGLKSFLSTDYSGWNLASSEQVFDLYLFVWP